MLKSSARAAIRLRGVRHNNLKNFDLDLPFNQLIVITGLSGSGKSSLAFDTLFAEGQRRYIETFSPYARQFFDRMDKPRVDSIAGIPPAIAIEQRNAVRTTRSTVGTMTELCDYVKMLWPQVAQLHCRQCGQVVRKDSPQQIWEGLHSQRSLIQGDVLITFDLPLTEKLSLADSLALVAKQGYQRLLVEGQVLRLDELGPRSQSGPARASLTIVQDRVKLTEPIRPRFVEACEQAYHFGKGKLTIWETGAAGAALRPNRFSNRLHCAKCDLEYREPSPALFSFNNPVGACPTCRGFGRVISIDYDLAVPDRSRTLAQGVVRPWQTGQGLECQTDLLRMCRALEIPTNVPFDRLPKKWQDLVIEGEPGYGQDEEHEWPRAWYGVKGYFRWLESKAYKMHVRVLLSRYRAYTTCPECQGQRFQPEALLYRIPGKGLNLADFYRLPIRDALDFAQGLAKRRHARPGDPIGLILEEVRSRLGFLDQVGLGYLTLDRPTRTLSGGETERVNLTTCLGTRLVNTLFVLDEPSVGLHPRDTERLVSILRQLRQAGNTVVVVEHEASVMRAADQIIDLGPGHGATGGHVVFQGTFREILRSSRSLTGQYLSGAKRIEMGQHRPVRLPASQPPPGSARVLNDSDRVAEPTPALRLSHATKNNLRDLSVAIPLGRLVCVTGVSGSGKTTLIREVLLPALVEALRCDAPEVKASDRLETESATGNGEDETTEAAGGHFFARLEGAEQLGRVVLVDQSILGKTPRSNPAVYIGAFDEIREFFAQSQAARQRGLNASAFSFNSAQGQCERCRGAGFEKIEMQFLSDVFVRCPDCEGRRYRPHILEVKVGANGALPPSPGPPRTPSRRGKPRPEKVRSPARSISDLLEATVEETILFLGQFPDSRPAQRAAAGLRLLEEVGLGYLALGQPINTLSGGECQRLKLVKYLAGAEAGAVAPFAGKPTIFLFDEPTTGLHFEDVRVLLRVFQRLVEAGHSVLVIEHNLDLVKAADWIIDLGPEAGDQGGQIVVAGTPERVAQCGASHTGRALRGPG